MKTFIKKIIVSVLTWEAKKVLERYRPKIVGITGSVGKTGTKDAIYEVLSKTYGENNVRKSQKSLNSEIGLPLAILGLENAWSSARGWIKNIWQGAMIAFAGSNSSDSFPKWLILEVGADHPGDIEKVGQWLHPDIVVLTRMADVPVHIEFFKNADDVLREKMHLVEALKPGGTLIVNADDAQFMKAVESLAVKKMTYGTAGNTDVRIIETGVIYNKTPPSTPRGQYGLLNIKRRTERIELDGIVGGHIMYSVAAACAVAEILGIADNLPDIFRHMDMPRGRMRLLSGKSGSVIIDDTYNSSPIASIEALNTLKSLHTKGRKIAVLADMKELGIHAEKAHRDIGKLAGETVHILITVGEIAKHIAYGAKDSGMSEKQILSFNTQNESIESIINILHADDIILIKGSQSMRTEKIVSAILIDPSKAWKLLVRQEKEWQKR